MILFISVYVVTGKCKGLINSHRIIGKCKSLINSYRKMELIVTRMCKGLIIVTEHCERQVKN